MESQRRIVILRLITSHSQCSMVDPPAVYGSTIHILSHMHEDHLKGLPGVMQYGSHNDSFLQQHEWDHGIIYCHEITYRLMLLRWPYLKDFLKPLKYGQEVTIDEISQKYYMQKMEGKLPECLKVKMRLIDANHCPGSSMILIRGPFGTVLHTGDVRYNSLKMLNEIGLTQKIDNLILDNTFCRPKEIFPS